ncbi:hypothetical protein C0995_014555 [Termitomyces sp. Mi166|nr:hypothetical protein C0995_014556 [Termitomyces sp. Mi166\
MTYICMTREGPGGKRRKELRPEFEDEDNTDVMELRDINYCFFSSDQDTLIRNKKKLFMNDDYDEAIVCHFHPYFESLKPLMRQWWKILRFAHKYPMFETIHQMLRNELRSTYEALLKQTPSWEDLVKTNKVLEERRKELEELRHPLQSTSSADPEESTSAPLDMSPKSNRILRSHHPASDDTDSDMPPSSPSSTSQPRKKAKTSAMNNRK